MFPLVLVAVLGAPSPSAAQSRRPTGDEWTQVRPLFPLVEAAAAGKPAPSDIELTWQNHFIDADAGVVLVPFTLEFPRGAIESFPVAMYVRVVMRGAPAPAPGPTDALAQYPFEDAAIVEGPLEGRISRAFTAPPGAYDVYVALTERATDPTSKPKTAIVKQAVTVPDLKSSLTTSSIIVAEKVEVDGNAVRASYEEQLDDPYRLFGTRITPATRRTFAADETLTVLFLVYQAKAGSDGKPDVEVSYTVHGGADSQGNAVHARVQPEVFNATTLPAAFNLNNGDLILAGRQVPLASLPPGPCRLEIVVTDKLGATSIRRIVPFSVGGARSR